MIDYWLFIPACFAINLAFGPNNLMAVTNGAQSGPIFAMTAATGRLISFSILIAISALGMGVILAASAFVFTAIKIFGAGYLVWIGWRTLKSARKIEASAITAGQTNLRAAFIKEIIVGSSNPKAILVFAAFFPQFVMPEAYFQSYAKLGAIFLVLEYFAIAIYATIGGYAARKAAAKFHWFHTVSGLGMMLFGALLLFTKRPV